MSGQIETLSQADSRIGSADETSADFSITPAAIFLPKFENAGDVAREQYTTIDGKGSRILVAYVKSSGSLWLMAGSGHVICSSKNGQGIYLKSSSIFITEVY
jgi:hypothetical protein